MSNLSALERVKRHLRKYGQVTEADFDGTRDGYVADGGKPFHRTTARIDELRNKHGWRIRTDMRGGRALYVLIAEPGLPPVEEPAGESEDERFDRLVPPVDDVIAQWARDEAA